VVRRSRARGARVGDPVYDLDGGVGEEVAATSAGAASSSVQRKRRRPRRLRSPGSANRCSPACSPPSPSLCCSPTVEVAGIVPAADSVGEEKKGRRGGRCWGKPQLRLGFGREGEEGLYGSGLGFRRGGGCARNGR
jgi:hypothetical protein